MSWRATSAFAALAGASLVALWAATAPPPLPAFAAVRSRWRPSDAQLLDRHGDPLNEVRIDHHGRRLAWTALDDISPALRDAVIESEDRRFYSHHGVDLRSVFAAIASSARSGSHRGASTISMQLAAMLDPSLGHGRGRRSNLRKLRQMRSAVALEHQWSKHQILEAYLNLVTYRGELQGIAAASRVMLGKAPHGLDRAESAILAALIRAPNASRAAVETRALAIRIGSPAREDIDRALAEAFTHRAGALARLELAPHLANRMLREPERSARCTLDAALQRFASETLRRHVMEIRDRSVDDGAVLVVENSSGEVWAYVGGSGDLASAQFVDGIVAMRQPGSALKPFLYALAMQQRMLTPATLLEDTPLELAEQRGLYRPLDYDRSFRGLVSTRTALASSLNIPAVRTADLIGTEAFARHLRALGFDGIVENGDYYGSALALGDADVSLWQLVGAYRALANRGLRSEPHLRRDEVPPRPRPIYDASVAFLISDILADRASRSVTFGLENSLATRYWSAVKTGTSKDMRDNWCVGYTDRFTAGVWVGNFSGAPMHDVSGITGAAPVWLDVMNYLHDRFGSDQVPPPAEIVARNVSFPRSVESERREWFLAGTEPDSVMTRLDESKPSIVSPAPESIIAIDPDIPCDRQRIALEAASGAESMNWMLDRKALGPARGVRLWAPTPGSHHLVLIGESGRAIDSVDFKVHGMQAIIDEERVDSGFPGR